MFIPVIPCKSDNDTIKIGRLSFNGRIPHIDEYLDDYHQFTAKLSSVYEKGNPILVIDVYGLENDTINTTLLKNLKIRNMETWLMTCIRVAEDLFDAFSTDVDMILVPYHGVRSREDIIDMHGVSDRVIPALFLRKGITYGGSKDSDPGMVLADLNDIGFYKFAVFDLDGSLTDSDWSMLREFGSILPYAGDATDETTFQNIGFKEILRSAL